MAEAAIPVASKAKRGKAHRSIAIERTMECVVCLEAVSEKISINCPRCDTGLHPSCTQQHLLHTVLEPHCPNCLKEWSHEFLAENLPKSWCLGAYKTHRENVLLDREKSLIPETQDAAAAVVLDRRYTAARVRIQEQLRPLRAEWNEIRNRFYGIFAANRDELDTQEADHAMIELIQRKKLLRPQIAHLEEIIHAINTRRYDLDTETINYDLEGVAPQVTERRQFIYPCPAPGCRGFLSTQWKCKICAAHTCCRCGDLLTTQNHICDKTTKASFELIRRESKPCPQCGVPITKISGCDHMFCVDCKTSFSWKTGEIHPRGNTNPLYWQWVERNGGGRQTSITASADPCSVAGITPNIMRLIGKYAGHPGIRKVLDLLSQLPHIEGIILHTQRRILDNDEYQPLRIKYILNELDEDRWRVEIQRIDKKRRKAKYLADIFELFVRGSVDIIRKLEITTPGYHTYGAECDTILVELDKLVRLCNTELIKVKQIFSSTAYLINENFTISKK